MCFLWSLIVVSVAATQLKAGCCFNATENCSVQTGEKSMMLVEKTFRGRHSYLYKSSLGAREA